KAPRERVRRLGRASRGDFGTPQAERRPPRATCAEIIATAAGVTPGMRLASPSVRGRRRGHFSTTSRESPQSAPESSPPRVARLQRLPPFPALPLPADVSLLPDPVLENALLLPRQCGKDIGCDRFDANDVDVLPL